MFRSTVDAVFNYVESILQEYPILDESINRVQETTGIRNRYIIFALGFVPLAFFLMPILINMVTIIYPLYMSVMAIEKGKDARTRWLIYWLLFYTLHIIDFLFGWMVGGFNFFKCIYLAWCMAPVRQNGCFMSYALLKPFLLKHIGVADQYISEVTGQMGSVLKENQQVLRDAKERAVNATVSFALNQQGSSKS